MPRGGPPTYTYSLPAIYLAIPGTLITAAQHNTPLEDIATTLNTAWPVNLGGTGGTSRQSAIDSLFDGITYVIDEDLRIADAADPTKIVNFDASPITTGTIRTQKVPDYNGTQGLQAVGTPIASAATTSIGAATGSTVHITGTTTITSFGTADAGIEKTVVFDGILTLTYNATSLILFSGVNITTYAGLTMTFVSEGSGNWRETSQTEARGTWTPSITFSTPGNLSVTYSGRTGVWRKLGKVVQLEWEIVTATFTHTTASGGVSIQGQPYTAGSPSATFQWIGTLAFQGISKAGFTQFTSRIAATGTGILVLADGSGVGDGAVQASDMPTGGAVMLRGALTFEATA